MFGLKSYAFDLFFTKRPAAVFIKSGKVFSISGICNVTIAECGMRIAEHEILNPRSEIRNRSVLGDDGVIPGEIRSSAPRDH